MKKKISLICPVYNEEATVLTHYTTLNALTQKMSDYEFEFIYSDNHSEDKTFEILSNIAKDDKRVKVYRLSRNFGYQNSIMTAYRKATGDAAINFDADLQDPPDLLIEMAQKWELGYKIIYGVRAKRKENFLINFARSIYYHLITAISEFEIPRNVGDFMLIDRTILNHLQESSEKNLYLRGLIFSFGYPKIGIPYSRNLRVAGETKFSFSKLIGLALDGVVNQSAKPLYYLFYIGIFMSMLISIFIFFLFMAKITGVLPFPLGTASIILFILFSITFNAASIGLIGLYLSRMFTEIKNRPISIIETSIENRD